MVISDTNMGGLEKYYDKDSLMDSIKFNCQFLDMTCTTWQKEDWQLSQFAELQYLISEWKSRKYEINDTIEWAEEVLSLYNNKILHSAVLA